MCLIRFSIGPSSKSVSQGQEPKILPKMGRDTNCEDGDEENSGRDCKDV